MSFKLTGRVRKAILFLFALILVLTLPSHAADYEVDDTGQDECYDTLQAISCPQAGEPFYGQDANYSGNTPSYIQTEN